MKKQSYCFIKFMCIIILTTFYSTLLSQNNIILTLEDIDGKHIDFSLPDIEELLCESEWAYGYYYVNFFDNGTFHTGVQETFEGKWTLNDDGTITVHPTIEGEVTNYLELANAYSLVNEYGQIVFYSGEYYNRYNATEDSKLETEIDLSAINKDDIIGIWVTDDQGPMGEWLGFKFTSEQFYYGNPGLEIVFGCWDKAIYNLKGIWDYDSEDKTISIYWKNSNDTETIKINLVQFYNGAFKGKISPDYSFDEVGDSERIFWKSECD